MALSLYETDDSTLATGWVFSTTAAGSVSASHGLHLWGDKGITNGTGFYADVRLAIEADIGSGVWSDTGHPLVDRREIEARVTGSTNPDANPRFLTRSSGQWTPLGAYATLDIGDIAANCSVFFEIRYAPSLQSGSGTATTNWRFRLLEGLKASPRLDYTGSVGIFTGVSDANRNEWFTCPRLAPTGTPDDYINWSAGEYLSAGVLNSVAAGSSQCNQQDGDGSALASGQAYIALITQPLAGGAVTRTKGVKDAQDDAVAPLVPSGHIVIGHALVRYNATGTDIEAGDITQLGSDGVAGLTYSASSLTVTVGRMRALTLTTFIEVPYAQDVILPPSATTTIYLGSDGAVSITNSTGALSLWTLTTNGSGVTAVTDARPVIGTTSRIVTVNGAQWELGASSELITLDTGDAETVSATNLAPAKAIIESATYRVTTTIATATAFTIKVTGGNVMYSIGTSTSSQTGLTAGTTGVLVPAAFADQYNTSATTITINTTGTPSAGQLRVTTFWRRFVAPTS